MKIIVLSIPNMLWLLSFSQLTLYYCKFLVENREDQLRNERYLIELWFMQKKNQMPWSPKAISLKSCWKRNESLRSAMVRPS